jgi:hypothetical protein
MKAYGEVEVEIQVFFFTPALVGGEWSASRAGRFTPGETAPDGTHWIRGWVGPRNGRDNVLFTLDISALRQTALAELGS